MATPPSDLKVINRQMLALDRSLNQLDAVREGRDQILGFEFVTDVKWRLAQASVAVENAKAVYDRAVRQEAKRLGVFEGMPVNPETGMKADAFQEFVAELGDKEVVIPNMPRFTLAELLTRPADPDPKARKTNPIQHSTLRGLMPIIDSE